VLAYRITGSRDYREGTATFDGGVFRVEPLENSTRPVNASVFLVGGVNWSPATLGKSEAIGAVGYAVGFHPWDAGPSFELGAAGTFGMRDYGPITARPTDRDPMLSTVPYVRLLANGALIWPWEKFQPLAWITPIRQDRADSIVALAVHAGGGFPFLARDQTRAGEPVVVVGATLEIRVPVADRVWIDFLGGPFYGDKFFFQRTDPNLTSVAPARELPTLWLDLAGGLRFGF
jgi:hypothetical protein